MGGGGGGVHYAVGVQEVQAAGYVQGDVAPQASRRRLGLEGAGHVRPAQLRHTPSCRSSGPAQLICQPAEDPEPATPSHLVSC